jgi:MSHA biogenesis protein MshL
MCLNKLNQGMNNKIMLCMFFILSLLVSSCSSNIAKQQDYEKNKKIVNQFTAKKSFYYANKQRINPPYEPLKVGGKYNINYSSHSETDEKISIISKGEPIQTFFQHLSYRSRYNILVSPDLKYNINISIKNVTIPELIKATHNVYHFSFTQEGKTYYIQPNTMRNAIFTINHLNVMREGVTETRVNEGSSLPNNSSSGASGSSGTKSSSSNDTSDSSHVYTSSKDEFWKDLKNNIMLLISPDYTSMKDQQASTANNPGAQNQDLISSGTNKKSKELDGLSKNEITNNEENEDIPSISINKETGLIVVHAYPDDIQKVRKYLLLSNLIERRQVVIEARIIEVQLSKKFIYGIDWNLFKIQSAPISNPFADTGVGNIFTVEAKYNGAFSEVIQYLSNEGKVSIISSPRIATLNNQKAIIKIGTDNYYVINVASNTSSSNISNVVTSTLDIQPFFSGVSLDVTPQISEDGKIILHLHPVITRVSSQVSNIIVNGQTNTIPFPSSEIRESDSDVVAESGKMIVIGGLVGQLSQVDRSHIPALQSRQSLSFFDNIFSAKNDLSSNVELVILLRPTISRESYN